jgi:hypothetical protein
MRWRRILGVGLRFALVTLGSIWARADQVEMQNGDRYVGNVQSLSAETLVLKNEMLGTVRLPRSKVAHINLSSVPPSSPATLHTPAASMGRAAAASDSVDDTNITVALHQLGAHTNLIHQVQKHFLADAGPEANQKFDELLNGLLSGKLNMDDLRAQAQTAADQLRELKRQGGENAGLATDAYLVILDKFLNEMPAPPAATNGPAPGSKAKRARTQPED